MLNNNVREINKRIDEKTELIKEISAGLLTILSDIGKFNTASAIAMMSDYMVKDLESLKIKAHNSYDVKGYTQYFKVFNTLIMYSGELVKILNQIKLNEEEEELDCENCEYAEDCINPNNKVKQRRHNLINMNINNKDKGWNIDILFDEKKDIIYLWDTVINELQDIYDFPNANQYKDKTAASLDKVYEEEDLLKRLEKIFYILADCLGEIRENEIEKK